MNSDKINAALLSAIKTGKSRRVLTAEGGIPVLDVFRVEALLEQSGSSFTETVTNFVATLPNTLKELRQALAQRNQARFHKTALGLKEIAGNMGAIALANLSVQLAAAGKNKNTGMARALMTQMEGEMQRTADALHALTDK